MLASVGCSYTLVGHSERRKIFNEVDGDLNHIVEKVQESGITPILCIGETKEEYELGLNEEICTLQLSKDLKGLKPDVVRYIAVIAHVFNHSHTHLFILLNLVKWLLHTSQCGRLALACQRLQRLPKVCIMPSVDGYVKHMVTDFFLLTHSYLLTHSFTHSLTHSCLLTYSLAQEMILLK